MHLLAMSLLRFMFLGFELSLTNWTFSDKHKSHVLCPGSYSWHSFTMDHLMLGSTISPSSFLLSSFVQTWADKVVLFLFGSSLKVWPCEVILTLMEFF